MNIKHYSIILFLLFSSSNIYSQKEQNIYEVTVFKWVKNGNDEIKKFVKIDSTGNVFLSNKSTGKKVKLKSFTKKINLFITDEKVIKIPGSDEPPRVAFIPKDGEQNTYINVTFLEDFHNEKHLGTLTTYSCRLEKLKVTDTEYLLYSYLDKKDSEVIRALLE